MKRAASVLFALILAWAFAANAAVVFNNGGVGNNGFISDTDFPQFSADDFTLAPGASTVTSVQWTGLYFQANTPQTTDIFTIQFYTDVGGAPSVAPTLTIPIGTANRTDTGLNTSFGSDIFAYSADLPLAITFTPGTPFWLSIFNNTAADTDDNWFWGMQDAVGNGHTRVNPGDPWSPNNDRFDFQLSGPVRASEPSVLALLAMAIGVAGLLGYRRKRAQ